MKISQAKLILEHTPYTVLCAADGEYIARLERRSPMVAAAALLLGAAACDDGHLRAAEMERRAGALVAAFGPECYR